jgi:hypothetical protein
VKGTDRQLSPPGYDQENLMHAFLALQITLTTLTDTTISKIRNRCAEVRDGDSDAGLSTLEITVLALGLFLLAGVAVLALTSATSTRLNQIK